MIFVTVGTDMPFDRMMREVDAWAGATGRTDVFAQIGETDWRPRFMAHSKFLEPSEFAQRFASATVVVAHAGMGTILSALRHGKPILVMPRRAELGEQRNDHQLATARRLSEMGRISVASDEVALRAALHELHALQSRERIGAHASPELVSGIRQFIFAGASSRPASRAVRARADGRWILPRNE